MLDTSVTNPITMAAKERAFYVQLGRRIAEYRKAAGITQVQLAEALGIAQQTMAHYEGGVSRVAVSHLPTIAQTLNVSISDLLGEGERRTAKRGPVPRIQQQLEAVSALPKTKQRLVSAMLDSLLSQAGRSPWSVTITPASLWEPEARWAAQEWAVLFEAERQKLFAPANAINQTGTYVQLGAAAKRSFEVIADQLLQRVRDLLAKREVAEQIGTPDVATNAIVSPLEHHALQGVPDGANIAAARGMLNAQMIAAPLQQTAQELRVAIATFHTAIRNEVAARLEQLDAAKKSAERTAAKERLQQRLVWWGIVKDLWPIGLAILAYLAGHFDWFVNAWHFAVNLFPHHP